MIKELTAEHFLDVLTLGEQVHGQGYMDMAELEAIYHKGIKQGINANFVIIENDQLIGFRLTYAAGNWQPDQWCTLDEWGVDASEVCYFKSNTIAEHARGKGLGGQLLQASIDAVIKQGAKAGVSHLWQQSPNNAAVRYFTKAGGKLIKQHPQRWHQRYMGPQYVCVLCGNDCHCVACEMLLVF
ncbi:GNAT family N-acetyltransferase [Shewanella gaetbuli]|uniref:GNAT family N-acetyltransferase n=1 Tax=Shewanella gaetbuli TaxID=220752 RepID=A0A9X2CG92_9GAMM|nr:GNAT family N-acetyltransferase [Shewanella gaetbuli]MCL1142158.1 GNAT family N-acetyltransferase [Shewanella gaetbuli]